MRKDLPIIAFTAAYIAIAAAAAVLTRNWEFVLYVAVVLGLASCLYAFHRRAHLSRAVLWALSVWGLMHMAGGLVPVPDGWPIGGPKPVLYSLWLLPKVLKYDHVVHAYGFGAATWASWQILRALLRDALPKVGTLGLCVLIGMGLGALNEMIEFLATRLLPETNVGGYANTGWDLVANAVGAIAAAASIWLTRIRPPVNPSTAP